MDFTGKNRLDPTSSTSAAFDPKLIVELDGGQHAESHQLAGDAQRTAFLERSGYQVLRFWNNELLQHLDAVVTRVAEEIERLRHRDGKIAAQ